MFTSEDYSEIMFLIYPNFRLETVLQFLSATPSYLWMSRLLETDLCLYIQSEFKIFEEKFYKVICLGLTHTESLNLQTSLSYELWNMCFYFKMYLLS